MFFKYRASLSIGTLSLFCVSMEQDMYDIMERLVPPKPSDFTTTSRRASLVPKTANLTGTQLMKPFSSQFKIIGLWKVRKSEEGKFNFKGIPFRCFVLLLIIYSGLTYKMLVSVSKAIFEGISKVPIAISDVFELVTGIATSINFLKHQFQIEKLFLVNWNILQPFNSEECQRVTRRVRYLTALSLTYVTILAVHCTLGITSVLPTQIRLQKVFGIDWSNYSWVIVYGLRVLVSVSYVITRFICSVSIMIYVLLCHQMNVKINQMVRKFKEWSSETEINSDTVMRMMIAWENFASLVRKVDLTYAPIVFYWFGDMVHRLVLYFPVAIQNITQGHSYEAGAIYLVVGTIYCVFFISMASGASAVNDACEDMQRVVQSFSYRLKTADKLVHQNTILFLSSLNCANVNLTGYNVFVIKRNIILTVGGMVFTYIVLLDQITQR